MLKIHDIKPIVQIPDFTIYIYYSLIVCGILLVLSICFWIYKTITNKKVSKEKEYFDILQNVDFNNAKQTAYMISKYGRLIAKSDEDKMLIEKIYSSLEDFKYKKNIPDKIPEDIKAQYEIFMESVNVK